MRNGGYFILDLTNGVIGSAIEKASDYIDTYKKPVLVYSTLTNPFFANYVRENGDKIEIGGVLEYDTTTEELTIVQGGGSGGATIHEYLITFEKQVEYGKSIVCATYITDNDNLTISDLKDTSFNVAASGYFGYQNVLEDERKIGWANRMYYDNDEQSIMIERTSISVGNTGSLYGVDPSNDNVAIEDEYITITKNR